MFNKLCHRGLICSGLYAKCSTCNVNHQQFIQHIIAKPLKQHKDRSFGVVGTLSSLSYSLQHNISYEQFT